MFLFPPDQECAIVARVSVTADQIREVFSHWRTHHPKAFPAPNDRSLEWRKIRQRFEEGYSVAQLCRAIDGIHKSPFHCGENDAGSKWLTIPICLRDASQVEKFIELANRPAEPVLSEKTKRNARALESWANRGEDQ
jgi:hypothetical protein